MTSLWDLEYWKTRQWKMVQERLDHEEHLGHVINPSREKLFRPLQQLSLGEVKVCIIGQDPYPEHRFATGMSFSIPRHILPKQFPPTLRTIFSEYNSDLSYPLPTHGDLSGWASQGVLLWNTIPSCRSGQSLSHDWIEWEPLTREVIQRLSDRGIVFVFLGAIAKRNVDLVDQRTNEVISLSHPSPRASRAAKSPFLGSRMFTTINTKLNQLGLDTIEWRICDEEAADRGQGNQKDEVGDGLLREGGRVLPNVNGYFLGPLPNTRRLYLR